VKHPVGTPGVFRMRDASAQHAALFLEIACQYPLIGLAPPPPSCCSPSALWSRSHSSGRHASRQLQSECGMSPADAAHCSALLKATGMSRLLVTAQAKDDCTAMQLINHAHRPDGLSMACHAAYRYLVREWLLRVSLSCRMR
jgi:hypothetical protein